MGHFERHGPHKLPWVRRFDSGARFRDNALHRHAEPQQADQAGGGNHVRLWLSRQRHNAHAAGRGSYPHAARSGPLMPEYRWVTNLRQPFDPIDERFLDAISDYKVGPPVKTKNSKPVEWLAEHGIVGIYTTFHALNVPVV